MQCFLLYFRLSFLNKGVLNWKVFFSSGGRSWLSSARLARQMVQVSSLKMKIVEFRVSFSFSTGRAISSS